MGKIEIVPGAKSPFKNFDIYKDSDKLSKEKFEKFKESFNNSVMKTEEKEYPEKSVIDIKSIKFETQPTSYPGIYDTIIVRCIYDKDGLNLEGSYTYTGDPKHFDLTLRDIIKDVEHKLGFWWRAM